MPTIYPDPNKTMRENTKYMMEKDYEQKKQAYEIAYKKELDYEFEDDDIAGPASYGMTDTMGRMHSDAQFAGSSSVPAHVEMMGLIGMGNNPMVGASVAVAVAVEEAMK